MISTLSAFSFNPDSPLIYGLYGAVVVFVVAMSLYYIVRSLRRAKALKMDMGKIKRSSPHPSRFPSCPPSA